MYRLTMEENGITAAKSVNVDTFYEIGEGLIEKIQGCDIFSYEFSRKNQAKNIYFFFIIIKIQ